VVRPDIASKKASTGRASGAPRTKEPDAGGQEEGLLDRQPLIRAIGTGKRHEPADQAGQQRRLEKGRPVRVALDQIERHGHEHGSAQNGNQQSDHVADGAQVKHRRQACRRRKPLSSSAAPQRA
jgi:hypothetical protein